MIISSSAFVDVVPSEMFKFHLNDLADMLWRHVLFGRLDIAKLALV